MNKVASFAALGVAMIGIGGFAGYRMINSPDRVFVLACEEVLADRLKSPATYRRIAVNGPIRRQATLAEFLGQEPNMPKATTADAMDAYNALMEMRASLKASFYDGDWQVIEAAITYDAANSYGTPLRDEAACAIVVRTGDEPDRASSAYRINGQTKLEWSIAQIRALVP